MSSMTFSQKIFKPTPPEKGSFPLDHEGLCKTSMVKYMRCLHTENNKNSQCRLQAKEYLDCRMKNNLMAQEEWSRLGFQDQRCTGSVATIKLPTLIKEFYQELEKTHYKLKIRVVTTRHATHFFDPKDIENVDIFCDEDEWNAWSKRGDEVLHIELGKWADILLLAPLDANSLGKVANGICDNILLCTVRAWDISKPLFFCPAMNTKMYDHPITAVQISTLKSWGYIEIPVIQKTLMCGDTGLGAMAEVSNIIQTVTNVVKNM